MGCDYYWQVPEEYEHGIHKCNMVADEYGSLITGSWLSLDGNPVITASEKNHSRKKSHGEEEWPSPSGEGLCEDVFGTNEGKHCAKISEQHARDPEENPQQTDGHHKDRLDQLQPCQLQAVVLKRIECTVQIQ